MCSLKRREESKERERKESSSLFRLHAPRNDWVSRFLPVLKVAVKCKKLLVEITGAPSFLPVLT